MKDCNVEIIKLILDGYQDSVKKRGYNGFYPFHEACSHKAMVDFIWFILEKLSQALEKGNMPEITLLHLAWMLANPCQEVIKLFMSSSKPEFQAKQ